MPNFSIWTMLYGLNGLESRQKILMGFKIFFFFGWARFGPKRLNGARRDESGPREKNLINKRAKSRSQVLAHGSGLGMQKPGPNPTRCHS